MGISLFLELPAIVSYWVVTVMCFVAMGVSTMFVVQIYTLVQTQTPPQLVGKIMATLVAVVRSTYWTNGLRYFIRCIYTRNMGCYVCSFYCFNHDFNIFKKNFSKVRDIIQGVK